MTRSHFLKRYPLPAALVLCCLLLAACGRDDPTPAITALPPAADAAVVEPQDTPSPTAIPTSPTATTIPPTADPTIAAAPVPSPTAPTPASDLRDVAQSPPPSPTESPLPTAYALVATDLLNLRDGPSTDYPIIGQALAGERYPILGKNSSGDWWQIDFEGIAGWVYGPLVTTQGDLSGVTVVAAPAPPPAEPRVPAVQVYETAVSIPTYPYADFTEPAFNADFNWTYRRFNREAYLAANPQPVPQSYTLVVLENQYLRLTFLPELGGRLYQAIFKPTGHNEFYQNPVIKPSPWGPPEQGGWLAAGGMEWGLPVEEHGYAWADRWGHIVLPYDPTHAGVTLFMPYEDHVRAEVEIRLRAGEAAFTVQPRITNPTEQPVDYKFWLDAMLAPGPGNSAGPGLRFVLPTSAGTVHSRSDESLPAEGQPMSWPIYQGVDYSRLGNWTGWLGLFERPAAHGPFAGVYDETGDEGIVRVFPAPGVQGSKVFGLGWADPIDPIAYTDDGSSYVELHGGVAPTFWDQASLAAGGELSWQETWYPVAGIGGISYADGNGAVHVAPTEAGLDVGLFPVRSVDGRLLVTVDDRPVAQEDVTIHPHRPFRQVIPVDIPLAGTTVTVTLLDADSTPVINYSQTITAG